MSEDDRNRDVPRKEPHPGSGTREQPDGGYGEQVEPGFDQTDQDREHRWNQNADDIGRQYDHRGFVEGGAARRSRSDAWSGETRKDRQEMQRDFDQEVLDDGTMTREEKLHHGWQDPDDPSQIANEGLIDEDEQNKRGSRIRRGT